MKIFFSASAVFSLTRSRNIVDAASRSEGRKAEGMAKPDRLVFAKYARKGARSETREPCRAQRKGDSSARRSRGVSHPVERSEVRMLT